MPISKAAAATKITLILDGQGAEAKGTTRVIAEAGTLPESISIPMRKGYDFEGYYTAKEGGGVQIYGSNGTAVNPISESKTLFAKWVRHYQVLCWSYRITASCRKKWQGKGAGQV